MEHLHIELVTNIGDDGTGDILHLGHTARIGNTEFPIIGFAVSEDEDTHRPLLSLVLAPDSIRIGEPAAGETPKAAEPEKTSASVWGAPGRPDPRANMPGWRPETLGDQEAHDHGAETWTCGCDPYLVGIQAAAAKPGNIDVRAAQL